MAASALEPTVPSDSELIERFLEGEERAFEQLYHRHARQVAAIVYRITGEDDDLDDIVQETFVDAIRGIRSLQDTDALRSWLITIAARKVRRRIAEHQRRRWLKTVLNFFGSTELAASPENRNEVRAALRALPLRLRMPWVLHEVEGETLEETARHCGVSLATAKRRIRKAKSTLERRLRP